MTLKLEGVLDVLKMYLHTEKEVVSLKQLKVFILDDIGMVITSEKNTKIALKIKGHQLLTTSSIYHGASIADQ